MGKAIEMIGRVFGRLVVVERTSDVDGSGNLHYRCVCLCGAVTIVNGVNLRSGHTKSCGCFNKEMSADRARHIPLERRSSFNLKHGHTSNNRHILGRRISSEYGIWCAMKTRCFNSNCEKFEDYGGRGIIVCDRWRDSFENFLADMGPRPTPKHSIDRINNDGSYEPGNCRWATAKEQRANQRPRRRVAA